MQEYKHNYIYELTNLVEYSVRAKIHFWNFNIDVFINAATKFSKNTLLHLYIKTTALNYYHRAFFKNGDLIDEDSMEKWYFLFNSYEIKINKFNFDDKLEIIDWFDENINKFEELFSRMANESFFILFANRQFLLDFNNVTKETVWETDFPKNRLAKKGTIKRVAIPKWVKSAVYHREKGRCTFCNTDLTNLVNTFTKSNYDHIVPLDLYGTNDPSNIQLTCETCNKKKTNKKGATSSYYIPWWPE